MAGAENSVVITDKTPVKVGEKSKMQGFLEFLYNKQTKTVLGRTGKSWLEITIFYIIFYSCLAAFFAINLAIFLSTLSDSKPRYYGKGSIIGINPGLGYQPWIKEQAESTLINFNKNDSLTYAKYTTALTSFFQRYDTTNVTGMRQCTGEHSNRDKEVNGSCIFDLEVFKKAGCGPDTDFGFKSGTPCVVLTLNKLIEWEPVSYPKDSLPDALPLEVREKYNGDVAVACEGEYFADSENIGELQYIPASGINHNYFPYILRPGGGGYHQPFAMVKFKGLKPGVLVEVECKAYAYNIVHDRANRLGMVHFEMLLQSPSAAS